MRKKRVEQETGNNKRIEFVPDESRIMMIQMLIPLGLEAVRDALQAEVELLAGKRYERNDLPNVRWGTNPGSVFLGDQKVKMKVPRVRDQKLNRDVPLETYESLQQSHLMNEMVLQRVINGISCRKYEKAVQDIPETFGIKRGQVSRKFIEASSKKLREFLERDLSKEDIVAIFIDGKTFAENEIVIAMGINMRGEKKILGFVETATENTVVIKQFLRDLIERGLSIEHEILFIIDGAKGLTKGIQSIFKEKAVIQRCQWHKRENIVSYLPRNEQRRMRKKLQDAYKKTTYQAAKSALTKIRKELQLINMSAVNSLDEGLEETLTLHKLDMLKELGTSFKTTNCIESFNRQVEIYTSRVSYWKNSKQRQRWFATAALEIEPKLRKVKGYRYLPLLRKVMEHKSKEINNKKMAA